ncbi:MAG TPA: histidine phosphatase family protein [Dehalococcoidia bacterium]|nr:histidine phosphatase family protein [Dehalococcoidia bacterium]
MPKLLLIKHSLPDVRPEHPPSRWRLSPEGSRRALDLAEALRLFGLARLYASSEPKASQTAALVAERLGVPWEARGGLEEHHRDHEPFLPEEEFQERVAALFARPSERVFGDESADEARARFAAAVEALVADDDVGIVAHGTVISLLVAAKSGLDAFSLWRRLGLPSYVVLETPSWRVVEVVEEVED